MPVAGRVRRGVVGDGDAARRELTPLHPARNGVGAEKRGEGGEQGSGDRRIEQPGPAGESGAAGRERQRRSVRETPGDPRQVGLPVPAKHRAPLAHVRAAAAERPGDAVQLRRLHPHPAARGVPDLLHRAAAPERERHENRLPAGFLRDELRERSEDVGRRRDRGRRVVRVKRDRTPFRDQTPGRKRRRRFRSGRQLSRERDRGGKPLSVRSGREAQTAFPPANGPTLLPSPRLVTAGRRRLELPAVGRLAVQLPRSGEASFELSLEIDVDHRSRTDSRRTMTSGASPPKSRRRSSNRSMACNASRRSSAR